MQEIIELMTCKNCKFYIGGFCKESQVLQGGVLKYIQRKPEESCANFNEKPELLLEYNLDELHKTYKELLYIENTDRIDIVLAIALSKKLEGIPIWLILVGASGDMKSAQLHAIRTEDSYLLHNLTSKTLVNGYQDKKKHPDLAPKLNDKIVVIPDMAQILKLPPVEKAELWGQLRDLYDGYAGKASGQGTDTKYENLKVTLVAGSTPTIDGQILVHQDLGTRELIYRTKGNKNKQKVMQKCLDNEESEEFIIKQLRDVTTKFLEKREIRREEISEDIISKIKDIAIYVTYMRATAEFDQYTHELRNYVYPEEPTRIVKQLKRIYICLKSLDDDYPDEKALRILWHLAKSSAFPVRVKIFEFLLADRNGIEWTTSKLAEQLHIGKTTTKRECLVLHNMGLLTLRQQETTYPDKYYMFWKINSEHTFTHKLPKDIVYTMIEKNI